MHLPLKPRWVMQMNVLIGCEESGIVRNAFALLGANAWSCDLLHSRSKGNHYQCDVMLAIEKQNWDIIILHPPCTALAVSGNRWYGKGMPYYKNRIDAVGWTLRLWDKAKSLCNKVCLENPVGVLNRYAPDLPKPQYVQPWQFGHGETKKTGLWLYGLPPLSPTNIVNGREQRVWKMSPSAHRKRDRSVTYHGIAQAMAEQWMACE